MSAYKAWYWCKTLSIQLHEEEKLPAIGEKMRLFYEKAFRLLENAPIDERARQGFIAQLRKDLERALADLANMPATRKRVKEEHHLCCHNCRVFKTQKELKRCGRCNKVCYCGVDCQRAHWPSHKLNCSK